ncbi:hypothetical protein [Paludibacterium denitrificans]|uniref:hypothetical protein n=1 Tax=Paludibacterium denitrificans TaxID=2675226 RepID=UPI001E40D2B0|nr:hypothetical protein [Paludibacterium denitrificans]
MVLTEAGQVLLREAGGLIAAMQRLEDKARLLTQGWEAEVRLAVDSLFPTELLLLNLGAICRTLPGGAPANARSGDVRGG